MLTPIGSDLSMARLFTLMILLLAQGAAAAPVCDSMLRTGIVPVESVLRVEVEFDRGDRLAYATAFVVHSAGPPKRPTLYLLTAAHAFLGESADERTTSRAKDSFDSITKIQLRYGASDGAVFTIKKDDVRFPGSIAEAATWFDREGQDVAMMKIISSDHAFKALPTRLKWKHPKDEQFFALGISGAGLAPACSVGYIDQWGPGVRTLQQWWVEATVDLDPGMSGGPVLFLESKKRWVVYALIRGKKMAAGDTKYVVALSGVRSWLESAIPAIPEVARSAEEQERRAIVVADIQSVRW